MADDRPQPEAGAEVIALWPGGPPSRIPDVGPETAYQAAAGVAVGTTMLRNVSEASLTVIRPAPGQANGVGVIVCPGGGWRILAWTHEGTELAEWLAARGYTAFLLKYRLRGTPGSDAEFTARLAALEGRIGRPLPASRAATAFSQLDATPAHKEAREVAADDGRQALALVRERAGEFGVAPDRIGMIGFSAGAFLAADVATAPRGPGPAFLAAIYGGETQGLPVPADAPPLFAAVAQDDRRIFRIVEGLYADWSGADRPAELHVFTRGGHGFGMVKQALPVDRWLDLFGDWLADQRFG